jgi:hypothetical protein
MILKPAPVSTRQFTYGAESHSFVAEMSDLNGFGQVYDDAADVGFTMVSSRTGREVVFVVADEQRDGEGDILFWTLKSTDGKFTATIFND